MEISRCSKSGPFSLESQLSNIQQHTTGPGQIIFGIVHKMFSSWRFTVYSSTEKNSSELYLTQNSHTYLTTEPFLFVKYAISVIRNKNWKIMYVKQLTQALNKCQLLFMIDPCVEGYQVTFAEHFHLQNLETDYQEYKGIIFRAHTLVFSQMVRMLKNIQFSSI